MPSSMQFGCHGDSGSPAFREVLGVDGKYNYQMAGISSAVNAACPKTTAVTYSAIKRLPIEGAIARLNENKVLFFPSKVDCWYPNPKNVALYPGNGVESTRLGTIVFNH